nr:MAG: hypothetical protein [Penaeus semisulcatus pemonivirus]
MSFARPRTLTAIALEKVVDLSLKNVIALADDKTEQRIQSAPKRKRTDPRIDNIHLVVRAVQDYVSDLPSNLIDEYVKQTLTRLEYHLTPHTQLELFFSMIFEIILSPRLTRFSDKWIKSTGSWVIMSYANRSDIKTLFNKLWKCSNLTVLSLTNIPHGIMERNMVSRMFCNFSLLTTLLLIPRNTAVSFHWVIGPVSQYCPKLKEFQLVYDGMELQHSGYGIGNLVQCRNLVSLCLLDFGIRTPERNVKDLKKLLIELMYLKCIFHKDLISAILETKSEIFRTLGLERLDLVYRCNPNHYGYMDNQKIVVDNDELLRVSMTCPATRIIKLMRPPQCLDKVSCVLPNLEVLEMTECCDIAPNLCQAFQQNTLTGLTVLWLKDVENIDYVFFSDLACACPNLKVLSILHSAITAAGNLAWTPGQSSAFPFLKELTLTPHRNFSQNWEVGQKLTQYLLRGTHELTYLHIHYCISYSDTEDVVTCSFLQTIMKPLKDLTVLQIVSPYVEWSLINELILNCSSLVKIGAFQSWSISERYILRIPDHIYLYLSCDCDSNI